MVKKVARRGAGTGSGDVLRRAAHRTDMTVIAVLVDPPRPGLVLPDLAATSPLSEREAAEFYAAMVKDVVSAVARSGGDLLVNYRDEETLPADAPDGTDPETAVREVVTEVLSGDVRFEPQVGGSEYARVGNTVTHLLREEEVVSAGVVGGNAPFLTRTGIDSAAMKLRTTPVVLGPSTAGRTYYAAFTEPIDFTDAFAAPSVQTLAAKADDDGLGVDFLGLQPVVERGDDLLTVLPLLNARERAGRIVPRHTAQFVADHGLSVSYAGDRPTVERH